MTPRVTSDTAEGITQRIVAAVIHHAEPGWCPACGAAIECPEQTGEHHASCPIAAYIEHEQAARLRRLRDARGLSLRDVQRATGVSAATLSRVERGGVPTLPVALRLARFYETTVEELFGETP